MMTYRLYFIFHPVRRSSCSMQSFNKKTMADQLVIFPFKYKSMLKKMTVYLETEVLHGPILCRGLRKFYSN